MIGGTDTSSNAIEFAMAHIINEPEVMRRVQEELDKHQITLNKNCVPNEQRPPSETSGVRIGTPAMTTRGWGIEDFEYVATKIDSIIQDIKN